MLSVELDEELDDELLDEPSSEIRLCKLASSLPGPPKESLEPLAVDELLLCDCKADIRFCRKAPMACAASDELDEVLPESELVELPEVPVLLELPVPLTPICDKASAMAPIKPPPPPGGGGGMLPTVLPESLPPDCELYPVSDVKWV